jgi:hypothetical protein
MSEDLENKKKQRSKAGFLPYVCCTLEAKLPWKVSKHIKSRQLIRATLSCGEFDVEMY